ncbi:MAG: PD40 domain-containing protein [Deltaproteobacteria bacterium]|nr:PD40 domain-containing protein [Deltaproteobacteria bacterium]
MPAARLPPLVALLALLAVPPARSAAPPPGRLALQPDLCGGLVAFVSGEDIWTVPASGGVAQRVTVHEGIERFPKFSLDCSRIAFTAEYDGNTDVFTMDPAGGDIRRVTWHPADDEVVGWHPVSGKILFRSTRNAWSRFTRLHLVNGDGTGLEAVPLPEAGWGAYSPDGRRLAYTRTATEDRTWKRYRGGLAPDLYLYDLATGEDRRLTDARGSERFPMWIGDRLYYQADPDGVLNLFSMDPTTGEVTRHTGFTDFDAGRPSDGDDRIVWDRAGRLEMLDPATGRVEAIPVEIRADPTETRPYLKDVRDRITSLGVSPDGSRAVLVARGDVFTVPAKEGITRNLTRDPGSREKDAVWSPDGRWIAFLSDKTGEYEIWLADPSGRTPPEPMTRLGEGYRTALSWSPDAKQLAFTDQTLALYVLDVGTKAVTRVDKAHNEAMDLGIDAKPISDPTWSPDGRFLAYTKMGDDLVNRIWIHDLASHEAHPVTGGPLDAFEPVFSADGRRLFFVSNRRFDPTYSDMEFELVYKKVAGLYALALRAGDPPLIPPPTGDGSPTEEEADGSSRKDRKQARKDLPRVVVDFPGIEDRVEPLPVPRGNYRDLAVTSASLLFLDADEGDFNRFDIREPGPRRLKAFDFEDREVRTLLDEVEDYAVSADGDTVVWRKGNRIGRVEASATDAKAEPMDLSGLVLRLDPRAEWRQIFREVYRIERDFFYDPGMHGLDWEATYARYLPLLEAASSRAEVRWVIGEFIGELATSHTYVYGGDRRRQADRVSVGMLGADLEPDPASGRWRIARILKSADWTSGTLPPLALPGLDVREGDLLVAVDGREIRTTREAYAWFEGLAGRAVRLTVVSGERGARPRDVVVVPCADERRFRYLDWLERNRKAVEAASGGRVGYLHLPDTYTGAAEMFPQYWYGQTRKEGLVVDGRFNAGGLDPDVFLDRLDRPILFWWTRRHSRDYATPLVATLAHRVLLTNRQAGSGGDMLPAEFRLKGMGPVVGTRTWGGLVGVSMFTPLVDGGGITAPDYRVYSTDGRWVIENEGITPDVEVDLTPADFVRGIDTQLMKAVEVVMDRIHAEPRSPPPRPTPQTTR